MGTVTIPVMPYIAEYGNVKDVVLSLLELGPPKHIRFPEALVEPGGTYDLMNLSLKNTSVNGLAKLGFAEFASFSTSANFFCSYMDLAVKKTIVNTDADSFINSAVFGLGFRLAVIAFDMKAEMTANFGAIASSAKLQTGMTSYQIISLGGGMDTIAKARPLLTNLSGDFTIETLETIGYVEAQLAEMMLTENDYIPDLMSVELDLEKMAAFYSGSSFPDPKAEYDSKLHYKDLMEAQQFALNRAERNSTLTEALAYLDQRPEHKHVDRKVVGDFYARILGLQPDVAPAEESLRKRIRIMYEAGT